MLKSLIIEILFCQSLVLKKIPKEIIVSNNLPFNATTMNNEIYLYLPTRYLLLKFL